MNLTSIFNASLADILKLDKGTKESLGLSATVAEIHQQGRCYEKTAGIICERLCNLSQFLDEANLPADRISVDTWPEDATPEGEISENRQNTSKTWSIHKQTPAQSSITKKLHSDTTSTPAVRPRVILTGAGSSFYVGTSSFRLLQQAWRISVEAVSTTEITTNPARFAGIAPLLLIHIARSGDSPESIKALEEIRRVAPEARHLIITCNSEGALARVPASAQVFSLVLPPETNDKSLVMTSSFSSMLLSVLLLPRLNNPQSIKQLAGWCREGVETLFTEPSNVLYELSGMHFPRVCYLGSGSLSGLLYEGSLKMQEMTGATVGVHSSDFPGLRHGPQVFVNNETLVVAHLSASPYVRAYEMDLLKELRVKRQGRAILAVCFEGQRKDAEAVADYVVTVPSFPFPDEDAGEVYRLLVDIAVEQQLALFFSLFRGIKPDNPSPDGTINRVVRGVRIY